MCNNLLFPDVASSVAEDVWFAFRLLSAHDAHEPHDPSISQAHGGAGSSSEEDSVESRLAEVCVNVSVSALRVKRYR